MLHADQNKQAINTQNDAQMTGGFNIPEDQPISLSINK